MRRVVFVIPAAVALGLGLPACGASNRSDQIRAAVVGYYTALAKRDAPAACRALTPEFWRSTLQDVDARLAASGVGPLPDRGCEQTLADLFRLGGSLSRGELSGLAVTGIVIRGNAAAATVGLNGQQQPAGLIRNADGRWQIDCCAGSQPNQQTRTTYRVPSAAMLPTLKPGQIVASDSAALRAHPPALNDIIAFHPPRGAESASAVCADRNQGAGHPQACGAPTPQMSAQTFIKRVVGLPGDRIAIIGGHVIRNGVREQDPYITRCGTDPSCNFPKPVVVPYGDYFVLGDNRGASDDSRFWGPIPRAWIVGLIAP